MCYASLTFYCSVSRLWNLTQLFRLYYWTQIGYWTPAVHSFSDHFHLVTHVKFRLGSTTYTDSSHRQGVSLLTFQNKVKWAKEIPVAFQNFANMLAKDRLIAVCSRDLLRTAFWIPLLKYDYSVCRTFTDEECLDHRNIQAHPTQSAFCTLMLLGNLAQSPWIQIGCQKEILTDVVCEAIEDSSKTNKQITKLKCLKFNFVKDKRCYIFKWLVTNTVQDLFTDHNCTLSKISIDLNITLFQYIFEAISGKISPIISLIRPKSRFIQKFTYNKFLNVFKYVSDIAELQNTEGFYICQADAHRILIHTNVFHCSDGSYISYQFVCDELVDCPNDNSDEHYCHCSGPSNNSYLRHHCPHSHRNNTGCSQLYFRDLDGSCAQYTIAEKQTLTHKMPLQIYNMVPNNVQVEQNDTKELFDIEMDIIRDVCEGDLVRHFVYKNGIFADCSFLDEDEQPLLGRDQSFDTPVQIPCKIGHSHCYETRHICNFLLNAQNHMVPCSNGGHLEDCKHFQCNMLFKCDESYCVPWSYVCDSKWDCPSGDDELSDNFCKDMGFCSELLKCKHSNTTCVHLGNLCDSVADCPLGDDELLCELNNFRCPEECQCLIFAVACNGWTRPEESVYYPHIFVSLTNSTSQFTPRLLQNFGKALFLFLVQNDIKVPCSILFPDKLLMLVLPENFIERVENTCFLGLKALKILDLNNNRISHLHSGTFQRLAALQVLNLSNNPLHNLPAHFMPIQSKPQLISLYVTTLVKISPEALQGVNSLVVDTNDSHICCIVPSGSECNSPRPWYISCSDLMQSAAVMPFSVFVSVLVFTLNAVSILVQNFLNQSNQAFTTIAVFLHVSDTLIVLYLCLIWGSHLHYKHIFFGFEELWRSSASCFVAFVSMLWFCIFTQLQYILLSLARLMVVVHPLDTGFKRKSFVTRHELCILLTSLIFSIILTLITAFLFGKLPSILCLPYVDPLGSVVTIQIMLWLLILTHFLTTVTVMTLHISLVYQLNESEQCAGQSKSHCSLFVQFVVITLSNILCWFPSDGVYMAAMFLSQYPIEMIRWATVTALPLNSITDPLVFSITSIRTHFKTKKKSPPICRV